MQKIHSQRVPIIRLQQYVLVESGYKVTIAGESQGSQGVVKREVVQDLSRQERRVVDSTESGTLKNEQNSCA